MNVAKTPKNVSLSSSCGTLHPDPTSLQVVVFTEPNSANSKPFHFALITSLFRWRCTATHTQQGHKSGEEQISLSWEESQHESFEDTNIQQTLESHGNLLPTNMLCHELSSPLKIFSVKFEQTLLESTGMCCCICLKTNNSTPQPDVSPYHHSHVWRSCHRYKPCCTYPLAPSTGFWSEDPTEQTKHSTGYSVLDRWSQMSTLPKESKSFENCHSCNSMTAQSAQSLIHSSSHPTLP